MESFDVVIVGAGIGGLTAAARLAGGGLRVAVYEQNERVGGKLNLVEAGGYRFDTGPSLLTMPQVLRDHFAAMGKRLADYLTLTPVEPICRYRWPDGSTLDASADADRMAAAIDALCGEGEGYRRFLAYSKGIYERTAEVFIYGDLTPRNVLTALRRRPLDPLQIDAFSTVHRSVSRFFRDPRLRQLFDRYATYNGSDPYRAPATLNVIPYVEYGFGAWYVQGGMYRIAEALARLAEEEGACITTSTAVQRIVVEGGRAVGVELVSGELVRARAVLTNADVLHSYSKLLAPADRPRYPDQRLAAIEPSCSGFVVLLGVRGNYPQLSHHNIFFSPDYRAEFADLFGRKQPSMQPTIYVTATSKADPTQAPAGSENIFILVNAPYLTARTGGDWWARHKDRYREIILARLANFGLDFHAGLEYEQVITPSDLAEHYGAWRGAIYGLSSNSRFAAFARPPLRASIGGLYFAGGSTHPGGGIPLVTLSGTAAARLIALDLA